MGENVRVYDFKVETCDDSGEPGGPPPSAVCAALVGTDNGRIVEVFEDGGDAVSYSGGSFGIYDLLPTADDPADVFAVDSTAPSALASTDAGDSWIATASDSLDYGTNAKDEAGKLYRRVLSAKSIETSDDGVVWTSLITGLANGPMALWVGDSHIWWTENADSALHRADLDGTNQQSYALGLPTYGAQVLLGRYGVPRLALYSHDGTHGDLSIIDISDPDSPSLSTTSDPFDVANNFLNTVMPLGNGAWVAVTSQVDGSAGAIWQSTDDAVSWGQMVVDASLGWINGNFYWSPMIAAELGDASDVWAGLLVPNLWHSTDSGVTWTQVTVLSDLGASEEWTSIAVACTGAPSPPVEPCVAELQDPTVQASSTADPINT